MNVPPPPGAPEPEGLPLLPELPLPPPPPPPPDGEGVDTPFTVISVVCEYALLFAESVTSAQ